MLHLSGGIRRHPSLLIPTLSVVALVPVFQYRVPLYLAADTETLKLRIKPVKKREEMAVAEEN